jgi:hypothetical protein
MTTTTQKLIFLQSENTPLETDAHHPLEICPTCGQQLLGASLEAPILPASVCPAEHEVEANSETPASPDYLTE